ncbi:hypothetical protein GQ44DRAFT_631775 [Phaeosphaeriaceae sp. PMI808]|nr:hypothetical protein GQ44DRAFT_631775 [Phaeosphaeriaceae sp. PMI808]
MDTPVPLPRRFRLRPLFSRPLLYPIFSLLALLRPQQSLENSAERKDGSKTIASVHNSLFRKICNFFGCILITGAFFYGLIFWVYMMFADTILSVLLAEYCHWANNKARMKGTTEDLQTDTKANPLGLAEEGNYFYKRVEKSGREKDCIAAIVGYREDPATYTMALESYLNANGCGFILACIDGNEIQDQEMVDVFQKVFPENSATLALSVPFAEIALQMDANNFPGEEIIGKCISLIKQIFLDNGLHFEGPDAVTRLCVTQPHLHKKGIMFTSIIVSLALSEILDIEFLWTSDSDSCIYESTLETTFATMAGDEKCVGASTSLLVYNRSDSLITQFGNSFFLNTGLGRAFSAAIGANECQSGPCAAFRIEYLRSELVDWYKQTLWGHRMIINEDRHLTTRLLLRGYRSIFIFDAITSTETPDTLRKWILQQVRWARSTHIESYAYPSVYIQQSPLLLLGALRRQMVPFFHFVQVFVYLFYGQVPVYLGWKNYGWRVLFTLVYLKWRNPTNTSVKEWIYSIPNGVAFHAIVPAIQVWSLFTSFADSWGTSKGGSKEERDTRWGIWKSKAWESGFLVVWMGIVGGVIGRWLSTMMGLPLLEMYWCIGIGMTTMWGIFGYWLAVLA